MQQVRYDAPGEVLSRETRDDGSVMATADVARCGIYAYRRADGSMRRELVLPEHLFEPRSLQSLAGVAVTACPPAGHPPEMITPANAARYAVGHVHETIDAVNSPVEYDYGYVRVRLTGRTADAVARLQQPSLYVSPGYTLPQYDATPGVHPVWGAYDAVQGPRKYNHLALTDTPRGGDQMVVHMDACDVAVQEAAPPQSAAQTKQLGGNSPAQGEQRMINIRLDAIGRDVSVDPVTAEILRQYVTRRDADTASATAKLEALTAELGALKAKIDEAVAAAEKATGEKEAMTAMVEDARKRADAAEGVLRDGAKLRALAAPRMALEAHARQYLPNDQHARIDAMTDVELQTAIVTVLMPSVAHAGVSPERLAGRYDAAIAGRQQRTDSVPPQRSPYAPEPQPTAPRTIAEVHRQRTDAEYISPPARVRRTT